MKQTIITIKLTEQNGRLLSQLLQQMPLQGQAMALIPTVAVIEDVVKQIETAVADQDDKTQQDNG